ncbi:MAG: hypothetical protein IKS79_06875 [Bacteroidales bacterium]|nr:hypothetical protein [Bacteroidales bacterium]
MRQIILFIAVLFSFFLCTERVNGQNLPKMDGLTFESNNQTLDFYSDRVIYHASGADFSRNGEYSFSRSNKVPINFKYTWNITIYIYIGERTTTLNGEVVADSQGNVISLKINNKEWRKW